MAEKEDDIVARAHRRFQECQSWESSFRMRFKEDIRFLYADSDNQEQWEANVRARRQMGGQPMVTINKTHTHWLHVVNQAKENKPSIKISATGGNATYESAQVFEGVIRHIEYKSKAQTAYKIATEQQVGGGIGYWRLVTAYADDNSFDQDIYIKQVPDAMAVYLDPNIKNRNGSDAMFGFVYEDMPRDKFERKYPNVPIPKKSFDQNGWIGRDTVRVAHYYEVEIGREWLYAMEGEDSTEYRRESDMGPDEKKLIAEAFRQGAENIQRRRVDKRTVRSYIIAGAKIAEKGIWPGKYIPIIRVPGEEITLEGKLDRKGLVRYLKDPQRAYNYNTSASLEFGALQSKSPYTAPVQAIQGLENYWATANTQNHAYLPYNHRDENGEPIPPPQRQDPPTAATAFIQGMQAAAQEMMMASGQYEATFSEQGNEIAGVAIENRKNQGERATFHYLDALADAIAFTGEQLIDLIPKIYDTKRIIKILAEDGEEQEIKVDPQQQQAVKLLEDQSENKVSAIFNPSVGKYDVIAEVGPNFETRRKESFQAMKELITGVPQLATVFGDLFVGAGDFPSADKLQERVRNWIAATNPSVLGEGPTPQEQQMQQQIQMLTQALNQAQKQLQDRETQFQIEKQRLDMDAVNHLAIRMENERKDLVNAFEAETKRLQVMLKTLTEVQTQTVDERLIGEITSAKNPGDDIDPAQFDPAQAYAIAMPSFVAPDASTQTPQNQQQAAPQAVPQQ